MRQQCGNLLYIQSKSFLLAYNYVTMLTQIPFLQVTMIVQLSRSQT